jgi:acetyl-CoA carboxylase carboxyl transferase subunit alpha
MNLTAERLSSLGLVDEVLREPLGGAHRDPAAMAVTLKEALLRNLAALESLSPEERAAQRQARLDGFGVYSEIGP